jgi:hypothetical protein
VPTIAFLYDGASGDSDVVSAPALAGLELAANEVGGVEIEPVDVGEDPDEVLAVLRSLGDDRGVVAAVVAPWTAPPDGAIELLASDRLPVVSLSWAWGPPRADGLWRSFAVDRAREAVALLTTANTPPRGVPICLAGDRHATSRALLETAATLGRAAGDPEIELVGTVDEKRATTGNRVATRVAALGCPVLAWIGGADALRDVVAPAADPPVVVGTSRIKTEEGLAIAGEASPVVTVCACADVTISIALRDRRFVHDLQAASGLPPGAFAVEAYDAGRALAGLVGSVGADRADVASGLAALTRYFGLAERYAFEADGARRAATARVGTWRAAGSRWLPSEGTVLPPTP